MKLQNDGISIIIPVYNGEPFIEKAYKNVLDQKLLDFEIIFVDNNSADQSVAIIESIVKKDKRVIYYKETKQGAAAARNKGLAHAKGDFIHFFDVDDQLFDGALTALKEVLINNTEIASVFGKTVKTSAQKTDLPISTAGTDQIVHYKKPFLGLDWFVNKSKLHNPASFLHRRTVFDRIRGFQEELLIGEDAFFHVRLGNEFDITYLDRDVLMYFRHPNSTVSRENRKVTDRIFIYWTQFILAYLPHCKSNEVSVVFKIQVYKQVFGAIGKMIVLTRGIKSRIRLKKKCEKEINPIKVPAILNLFIYFLVLTGNFNAYKFYFFYVLEPYFKLKLNRKVDG